MYKTNSPYYFAYGSNLSLRQMKRRCPHATVVGRAKIKNHKFVITGFSRRWHGGVATIEKAPDHQVWGIVYELDDHCLKRLDLFEGVRGKRYSRKQIYCHFANGKKRLVTTYLQEPRRITHSGRKYRRVILDAATSLKLPADYVNDLDRQLRLR